MSFGDEEHPIAKVMVFCSMGYQVLWAFYVNVVDITHPHTLTRGINIRHCP